MTKVGGVRVYLPVLLVLIASYRFILEIKSVSYVSNSSSRSSSSSSSTKEYSADVVISKDNKSNDDDDDDDDDDRIISSKKEIIPKHNQEESSANNSEEDDHQEPSSTNVITAKPHQSSSNSSRNSNNNDNHVKILWMYWDKGRENLESHYGTDSKYAADAACVKATLNLNQETWDIRILDKETARKLAPKFAQLADEDVNDRFRPANLAAFLRLELLSNFGGVWVDTSICPFRSLDDTIPHLLNYGKNDFFVLPLIKPHMAGKKDVKDLQEFKDCFNLKKKNAGHTRSSSNYFLVSSQPHNIVYEKWVETHYENMLKVARYPNDKELRPGQYPYFICHCSFTQNRLRYPEIEKKWKKFLKWSIPEEESSVSAKSNNKKGLLWPCFGAPSQKNPHNHAVQYDPEYVKKKCYNLKKQRHALYDYVQSPAYEAYIQTITVDYNNNRTERLL